LRRITIISLAAAAALAAIAPAAFATAAYPAPAPAPMKTKKSLQPLVQLSAERLLVSDEVAAAKWGTGKPIDDPAREQQVIDEAAAQARQLGTDPAEVVRFFQDQIAASKDVQRGLFRLWHAEPSKAPTTRPDLSQIRVKLNSIDNELIQAIADTDAVRSSSACEGRLTAAYRHTHHALRLDALHTFALRKALPHVCEA
jgi:chorismate mutase